MYFKTENDCAEDSTQVSDLCPQEDVDHMMQQNPEFQPIVHGFSNSEMNLDWSSISVPDPGPTVSPTGELPASQAFEGLHLFDVHVDVAGSQKKSFFMSTKLNKLFIDMNKVVPLKIRWDGTPGLWVRALMLFTQPDSMRNPVRRCLTHKDEDNPINTNYPHREHVLACENRDAKYECDGDSKRYSLLVPLALQQGAESAQINIKFMCKTSCPGGLNRALTDVIFTLEDSDGTVHGRQKFSVKICSCPKRDKDREEQLFLDNAGKSKKKKREEKNSTSAPATKKIKIETENDERAFLIRCKSARIAENVKALLRSYEDCVKAEVGVGEPLFTITEHITTIEHPYGQ